MRKFILLVTLHLFLLPLFSFDAHSQQVVINEFINEASDADEWVELITITETDLRGYQLRDFSSTGLAQEPLVFASLDFWSQIKPGVILLIIGSNVAMEEDLDASDGTLVVKVSNDTLFSGNRFIIAGNSDAIQLQDDQGNHIHGLSFGSANSNSLPAPSAHISASLETGQSIAFFATQQLSNFTNGFFVKTFDIPTPAAGNDEDNTSFIRNLFFSAREVPQLTVELGNTALKAGSRLRFSKLGETKTIIITNSGNEDLQISTISVDGEGFGINPENYTGTLSPEQSQAFDVTFTPQTQTEPAENFTGTLSIQSNAADNPEFIINLESRQELTSDDTFEIVTWNIEWFGSPNNGPSDEALQLQNAATLMRRIDADVYALQEITSENALKALADNLVGYRAFIARHISIQQKTAFVYKTSTIDSISAVAINTFQDRDDWAQRLPFKFTVSFQNGGESQILNIVNIHAKANTGNFSSRLESYQKRVNAADDLHRYMSQLSPNEFLILAGDYNDDIDVSIFDNRTTPYDDFINDERNFRVVTAELSQNGERSTVGFSDMIDHITISDELFNNFIAGSQDVVRADDIISGFGNTTSDHFPVMAVFDFSGGTVDNENFVTSDLPKKISLRQNFPNPFNPSTNILFNINKPSQVSLKIYDILGREVAAPIVNQNFTAGDHQVTFRANNLSSGVYVYRLSVSNDISITRKMTLIK